MLLLILGGLVAFFALLVLLSPLIAPKKLQLCGAHVVITGGSSGIGKAIAKRVIKEGGSVTLLARDVAKLAEAKTEISKLIQGDSSKKVHCISVDVSKDFKDVESAIKAAEEVIGPVQMLINCAGFSVSGRFEDIPITEFQRLMQVNYFGALYSTRAVIKGMMTREKGRIVFLSSQAGQLGLFGFTGYSPAKFALRGLAESLQMEMKPYNIQITIAFPPDTDTPGLAEENKSKPPETKLISAEAGIFDADFVAKKILKDAVKGKFLCSIGLEGFLLSTLTCGMSPVISIINATMQVVLLGLFRAIGLIYLDSFDRIIKRCKTDRERKEKVN